MCVVSCIMGGGGGGGGGGARSSLDHCQPQPLVRLSPLLLKNNIIYL